MPNRRMEPVSYRKFSVEPQLADGLLAVARPGGELMERVSAAFFRLADEAGQWADQEALRRGKLAGEQAGVAGAPHVTMSGGAGDAAEILRREEGFREKPYWDVNAWRVGYGSDTITKSDGSVVKVTKDMRVSREDAERDLQRRLASEFGPRAAGQVGADTWNKLPGNVRAALGSVAYNYGSLPGSVVAAARGGDVEAIASAVEGLSANKGRRQREAAIIRTGVAPGADATFTASGGSFRPMAGSTLVARAYNEAGQRTYLQMLDTEMLSVTSQAFELYKDDPARLEKALGALKGEMLREHVFPEIAGDFEVAYGRLALNYMEQGRKRQADRIEAQDRADFVEQGAALNTSLMRDVANLDPSSPDVDAKLGAHLGAIDRYYDAAADRGVITPAEAAAAKAQKRNAAASAFYLKQASLYDADGVAALREQMAADFGAGELAGIDGAGFADLDAKLVALEEKKQRDAAKAAGDLERRGTAIAQRVFHGFDADTDELTRLEAEAGSSPGGGAIADAARQKIAAAAALRDLSPEAGRQYVAAMRERLGSNPSDAAIETYDFAKARQEEVEKAVLTDPLGHAQDTGKVELAAIDTSSPQALEASFAARRQQAQEVAQLYGSPTMLYRPGEVKALKADMASLDAGRYASAMSQLDLLAQQGGLDPVRDIFGDGAVERVQDWQARLRYASPEETAQWLKDRADPRWQERVKPLVTKGETEARKVPLADLVAEFDDAFFSDPAAPLDLDSQRMLQADFVQLAGERYAATQDAALARRQAVEQMKRRWGVTRAYGSRSGRLMPYPPEKYYPAVSGSHDWLAGQLADVAKERGYSVENLSLIADGQTKAGADNGMEPGYLIAAVDPESGLDELLTDKEGRVLRFNFDFPAAVQKAAAEAAEKRRTMNDPWIVINEGTSIGPFYPPWRPATAADLAARGQRVKEILAERPPAPPAEPGERALEPGLRRFFEFK